MTQIPASDVPGMGRRQFMNLLTFGSVTGVALGALYPPWNSGANKFMCPCHGSQYDSTGKVVRGPAPLSLALANVSVDNDNVFVSQWTETDFRTGEKPWWS